MNTYLYPEMGDYNVIKKVNARNYRECEEKIKTYYSDKYDLLDSNDDFNDFLDNLEINYNIVIGKIYEIDEFI